MIHLASNENPQGMPDVARRAAAAVLHDSSYYPDATGGGLRQSLATRLGVPPDWIVLGSGSSEILTLTAQALVAPGLGIVYSQYGFIVYGQAVAQAHAVPTVVPALDWGHDLQAMREAVDKDTRLVFVANPNNPTGTFIEGPALLEFAASLPPSVTLLLDEAYGEYLQPEQRYNSIDWVRKMPNLLVARTFSKAYGLAGLRVGYAVAQPWLASRINALRPRFNVTTPALAAARAALADSAFLRKTCERNAAGRAELLAGFAALGLECMPAHGNFVTVRVGDAKRVHELLLEAGIETATLDAYGLPEWLRISTGLPEHHALLLRTLGGA